MCGPEVKGEGEMKNGKGKTEKSETSTRFSCSELLTFNFDLSLFFCKR